MSETKTKPDTLNFRASQQCIQQKGELTFQERKLTGSTTVGWMISLPGKIPQVTALGCRSGALVMFWPCQRKENLSEATAEERVSELEKVYLASPC